MGPDYVTQENFEAMFYAVLAMLDQKVDKSTYNTDKPGFASKEYVDFTDNNLAATKLNTATFNATVDMLAMAFEAKTDLPTTTVLMQPSPVVSGKQEPVTVIRIADGTQIVRGVVDTDIYGVATIDLSTLPFIGTNYDVVASMEFNDSINNNLYSMHSAKTSGTSFALHVKGHPRQGDGNTERVSFVAIGRWK